MAFVPCLIPLGVSLAKIVRNMDEDEIKKCVSAKSRGKAIVDHLTRGGDDAPIRRWTAADLEKAIERNSIFRNHADDLRSAHAGLHSELASAKNANKSPLRQENMSIANDLCSAHAEMIIER